MAKTWDFYQATIFNTRLELHCSGPSLLDVDQNRKQK